MSIVYISTPSFLQGRKAEQAIWWIMYVLIPRIKMIDKQVQFKDDDGIVIFGGFQVDDLEWVGFKKTARNKLILRRCSCL